MPVAWSLAAGGAAAVALGVGGCTRLNQNDPARDAALRAQARRHQQACGSPAAYDQLKGQLFDQAIAQHHGDRAGLDTLADYSFVRMEAPVVKGWDPALDVTRCQGRIVLEVPAGAKIAFSGEQHLHADIDYTAQAAADGNGLVYRMTGADPIISQLAVFHLDSSAYRPPPAIDNAPQGAPETPETSQMAQADVPTPTPDIAPRPPAPVAEFRPVPGARQRADAYPPAPSRNLAEPARPLPPPANGAGGRAAVLAFYAALGTGDGERASAHVVPEKRGSRAFSADAIERFYSRLPEPLRLTGIAPLSDDAYRVSYRYSAGRSRCNGSAVVTLANRDGQELIRSIRALGGC